MCKGLLGCVLILVNIIFMLVGLALSVLFGLMLFSRDILDKVIDQLVQQLQGGNTDPQLLRETLGTLWKDLSPLFWGLFALGLVIVLLSIMAFLGICCRINCIFIIYVAIVGLVLLANLVFIIVYFAKPSLVFNFVDKHLNQLMMNYVSIENGDFTSVFAALLMQLGKCCGYNNENDFRLPEAKFSKQDSYNGHVFQRIMYPMACCASINPPTTGHDVCPNRFTASNSYIGFGCKDIWEKKLKKGTDILVLVTLVSLGLEAICFAFGIGIIVIRKRAN